jgi:hypothetical protein
MARRNRAIAIGSDKDVAVAITLEKLRRSLSKP